MLQIKVAFGYEKKIWPEEPAPKNYLAPILSEKNILTQTKHPSLRPLNIKWTVPYAIPSRGNSRNDYYKGHKTVISELSVSFCVLKLIYTIRYL